MKNVCFSATTFNSISSDSNFSMHPPSTKIFIYLSALFTFELVLILLNFFSIPLSLCGDLKERKKGTCDTNKTRRGKKRIKKERIVDSGLLLHRWTCFYFFNFIVHLIRSKHICARYIRKPKPDKTFHARTFSLSIPNHIVPHWIVDIYRTKFDW